MSDDNEYKPKLTKDGRISRQGLNVEPEDWMAKFLDALAEYALVKHAAKAACITTPTVYKYLKLDYQIEWRDEIWNFKDAFEFAKDTAVEAMEAEVRRRAFNGTRDFVVDRFGEEHEKTVYSDTLAMFVLKAEKPNKYRDRYDINSTITSNEKIQIVFEDAKDESECNTDKAPVAPEAEEVHSE